MKKYFVPDAWKIIEDTFDPAVHPISESIMSIGNGRMGQRANFPESYSGETLQGSYLGGVYYPDKTRVGWWKNGYPEYFAKVLNSVNWIGIRLYIENEEVDLAKVTMNSFHRELDMQRGILKRTCSIETPAGHQLEIASERFYSIEYLDSCLMRYSVTAKSDDLNIRIESYLNTDVRNNDSNYDEDFWQDRESGIEENKIWVSCQTKKTHFTVRCAASHVFKGPTDVSEKYARTTESVQQGYSFSLAKDTTAEIEKHVVICTSFNHPKEELEQIAMNQLQDSLVLGYVSHKRAQIEKWRSRWAQSDIEIEGDIAAQQGIRFNIFQLFQTYSGEDPRLNIGPKGFTGEKYGGSTYWDTEAYCLPFYMGTADQDVSSNLLKYRYSHLEKAIENATKLGFGKGAALYPMVTINGEECHNEWEITFEEIHRNGAIAFAIYNYARYTGDTEYIMDYGMEVLIGICRFWAQRVHKSPDSGLFVMLGVTGPNEYENNVDNNWYTNYIAKWCLQYTASLIEELKKKKEATWSTIACKTNFETHEIAKWQEISQNMYLPKSEKLNIFLQQDGFLNKQNLTVKDIPEDNRPINQNWSWDRILRSPFIKQADVLQGLYFFEDHFTLEEIKNNFLYYEPRTVHESSLSPCVHAILASRLGMKQKAYEMYLRTARLDLDNYNNDTEDGCHITSMAGTWMSIVEGFAGLRIKDGLLTLRPFIPYEWDRYSFHINYRGYKLKISISKTKVILTNFSEKSIEIQLVDELIQLPSDSELTHLR